MYAFSSIFSFFKKAVSLINAIMIFCASGGGYQMKDKNPAMFIGRGCYEHFTDEYSWCFYEPTVKLDKTGNLEKNRTITMYCAKNETEYCQIAIRCRENRGGIKVRCSDFMNENGDTVPVTFCEEYYVKTTGSTVGGSKPDALVPIGESYENYFLSCNNYTYAIIVTTDKSTPAGDYKATVTVGDPETDSKGEYMTAELTLHVWDFTLPDTPSLETAIGLTYSYINKAHNATGEKAEQLNKDYYEFLLEHHISAYSLPVDILSDEADAYMSDPRCTSFEIPYGSDEYISAVYEKLSTNEEWMKKAYFYPIDEPCDENAYEQYYAITDRLARLFPGYHMVTPFYVNTVELGGETYSSLDLQAGRSDIICAITNVLDNDEAFDKAKERQADGDRLWCYVCCGPGADSDYCNMFVEFDGLKHRELFWQQYQLGIDGFLYWSSNYWYDAPAGVWANSMTAPWAGITAYGDGSLLYPGVNVNIDGPCSSLRLEAIANGIEDYEYLTMARELLGEKKTDAILKTVTNGLTNYTKSDSVFAYARVKLGKAIEAELRG